MKVAYTALHYGTPYLAHAIYSVIDHVDKYIVLYSAHGSHGTRTDVPVPECESRERLYHMAKLMAGNKLQWIEGDWVLEGNQRDAVYEYVSEGDVVLTLDYDEIWPKETVEAALRVAGQGSKKTYRVPMVHFWRSFCWAVLHDPAYPERVVKVGGAGDGGLIQTRPIAHMGYAIPDYLMRYKWQVHGHRVEFRQDVDWFTERWETVALKDTHPVGSEFWNPESVNPFDYLPEWMKAHPYHRKEVIR